MGIFNFFKKEIKEIENISKDNLSEWILNKEKQHKENEQDFLKPILNRISQLVSELKQEISVLENIDFSKKKVESRVKTLIKNSLKDYLEYLQKMIERLNEIKEKEKIVEKINFVFEDFNKRSKRSYEKTTFIIGKEMQATKDSIKKFLKDLEKILKENSKMFEEFKIIGLLEEDVKKLKKMEKEKYYFLKILNEDSKRLKQLEKKIEFKKEEIKNLKQSKKFNQEEDKRKKLELKKQELEKDINSLNSLIDFKALSSFYHKFEKEMRLVKEYKNNFKQTLKTNNLTNILKEARLDNEKIRNLIEDINKKEREISKTFIDDFGIEKLKKEIGESKFEILGLEKLTKEKRLKNLDQNLEEQINKIKKNLEKINVELN